MKIMKKKHNYDYCQAAPVLEWMSQKWALVVMLRIEEYEKESIRFSELFRTIPQVWKKYLRPRLIIYSKKDLSLLTHGGMYEDLQQLLGREVDLVVDGSLRPYAQESVERDKILVYERAS